MFLLGLTGSIGMGKSTTAQMFAEEGCALWDADAAVHRLYGKGGAAVPHIAEAFPAAVIDGEVSRDVLKDIISEDKTTHKKIESMFHRFEVQAPPTFLQPTTADIVVLDIPLLFETGGADKVDAVACVFIDDVTQKQRVMARGTMTEKQFETIRAKQMPAADKAAKADYVIETDTLEHARSQVKTVVADIRRQISHA